MPGIVPNQPFSVDDEIKLSTALLLRSASKSDADRYWQEIYPGYKLSNHETKTDGKRSTLHLYLEPTGDPICPKCGRMTRRIKDSTDRTVVDSASLGANRTLVHLPIRRVRCECGCQRTERIVWLDSFSRHTRRLTAVVQLKLRNGPGSISQVSSEVGLSWKTVKEIDKQQLKALFSDCDVSNLRRMAIDEFAIHKGHKYATAFMNLDTGQIFYVVKGKTQEAISEVFEWLIAKGVANQIECVAVDMNAGFPAVVKKYLPKAHLVYDLFHVMQSFTKEVVIEARKKLFTQKKDEIARDAADAEPTTASDKKKFKAKVKRDVRAAKLDLQGAEWLLVRSQDILKKPALERLEQLLKENELLAALYPIAEQLRGIWKAESKTDAADFLADLKELVEAIGQRFQFAPAKRFAKMLERRSDGITNACVHKVGTNRLEGANNKIKVLKRTAYGFRDFEYFALKIKGLLPGKGTSPWDCLSNGRAVIDGVIRETRHCAKLAVPL